MIDKVSEFKKEIVRYNVLRKELNLIVMKLSKEERQKIKNITFLNDKIARLSERERIKEIIQNMKNAFDSKPNDNRYNIVSESCQILLNEIGEVK